MAEALQAIVDSISQSYRQSNRHGVSAVIEQLVSPTGKTGKGHEDAWRGNRRQPITA